MSPSKTEDHTPDDDLTRLTRGLAHDFNNLLAIIAGNIQLARERITDPKTVSLLEEAEMASTMAAGLIQRLKAVATDQPLRLEITDVGALLCDALATFKAATGQDISIEVETERDAPPVRTDRHALVNAVLNLVLNARDAMPDGGMITLAMRTTGGTGEGAFLEISVTDDGRGMPPEILRRAFDPYFSTKSPADGRGLGLASVRGFARQCGGRAAIESTPGNGTRVTIAIPVAADGATLRSGP